MRPSPLGRKVVIASIAIVALAGAFLIGRLTAPDHPTSSGPDCSKAGRFQISAPAQFLNTQGTAYFSQCEQQAAMRGPLGSPAKRVNIYADATGKKVLAWWYPDCGMPEGFFAVGTPHPATCADVATTSNGATTTS